MIDFKKRGSYLLGFLWVYVAW